MQSWKNEHIYIAFDGLIRKCEDWIKTKKLSLKGFRLSVVHERLIQRISELTFYPYSSLCTARNKSGVRPFPDETASMQLGGLCVSNKTGKVSILPSAFMRSFVNFSFQWAAGFIAIVAGFFSRKTIDGPVTLAFGIGPDAFTYKGNDNEFLRFCKEGPVKPLSEASRVIVQYGKEKTSDHAFLLYAKNPVNHLVRYGRLGIGMRVALLAGFLVLPFLYIWWVIRFPLIAILAREIVLTTTVQQLQKKRLIEGVILTNSNFFEQSLWMREHPARNFLIHKLHYSQNTRPFVYKKDPFIGYFPPFRHIKVDTHWVWTDKYKEYMYELGHQGSVEVVGPILFYLPEPVKERTDNEIRVAVFDVTPVYKEYSEKIGVISNYYSLENMLAFISGIVEACKELENETGKKFHLLLKSKRSFKDNIHHDAYIEYIQGLSNSSASFTLLDYSENLFTLIKTCDISVSYPYTSVPYVASGINKPAIYFDAGAELLLTYEPASLISGTSCKKELKKLLAQSLNLS